jgi:Tfp pilus assembly major pilin PilA
MTLNYEEVNGVFEAVIESLSLQDNIKIKFMSRAGKNVKQHTFNNTLCNL